MKRVVSARSNGRLTVRRWIGAAICASLIVPRLATALTLTVPDQVPTIQAALDSFTVAGGIDDTLFLRGSRNYNEAPSFDHRRLVLRWAPLSPGESKPKLDGLGISESTTDVVGVHFTGPVTGQGTHGDKIYLSHCLLDAGLDYSGEAEILSLVSCAITGGVIGSADGQVVVDSCAIVGGLGLHTYGGHMNVTHSTITGSQNSVGIGGNNMETATVIGCTVRGVGQAMILFHVNSNVEIRDNVVEDCATGIHADAGGACTIAGNVVRRSGGFYFPGIFCYADDVTVSDNIIEDCHGAGILGKGDSSGLIEGNLVSGCGGDGIWTDSPVIVRNNTSCSNVGSGIQIDSNASSGPIEITHNIGYANGGYGLFWGFALTGRVECNDWFANQLGAVGGDSVSPGDLEVDPMFCDTTKGDYRLSDTSPLANHATCGLIGALGIGCGATPTLISQFSAERIEAGVRLVWESSTLRPVDVWLERADHDQGPWNKVAAERRWEGEAVVELDHSALPERSYWYRLVAGTPGQVRELGALIESRASLRLDFRIVQVAPNPASGQTSVALTVGREATIAVDLFDTQGRNVATLTRGVRGPGRHVVQWSGRIDGKPAPPGLYLIRYRFPGGHQDGRLVVMR